jgi:hypothetical protein
MAINNPAEIPEGGEGGSGPIRFRPGVGGPNELPPFEVSLSYRYLVEEIFSLRNRVYSLESHAVASRLSGFASVALPNELPEGGEGGGGRGVFHPPKEIAELPIDRQISREVAVLSERFTAFESKVLQSIQGLQARIDAMKR